MNRRRVKVGDILAIPLSDGRIAYAQYVFLDRNHGPLLQVYDMISDRSLLPEQLMTALKGAKPLFPPVITGLFAAVRTELWSVVGNRFVDSFVYPMFVSVLHEEYQPKSFWFVWDGEQWVKLGKRLPEKYKNLEFLAVWDPHDVVWRIETGENPYAEMIKKG